MKKKVTNLLLVFAFIMAVVFNNINAEAAKTATLEVKSINAKSLNYNTIEINWGKVRYAKEYQLYRSESENGTFEKIWTTSKRSFKDEDLKTGQKYYYKVCAVNGAKKGEFSSICYTVPELETSKITGCQPAELFAELAYTEVEGAEWYQIYRGESEEGPFEKVGDSKELKFTDDGLVANTDYYYLVKACKAVGESNTYGEVSKVFKVTSSDHDYDSVVADPGFTELGYTTFTCKNCEDTYVGDYVDPVKDYIREEVARVAEEVNSTVSDNSITFILASDMHNASEGELADATVNRINTSNKHAGQAMSLLADNVDVEFFAGLGDFAWGDSITTTEQGTNAMKTVLTYLEEVRSKTKSMLVPGNHDSLLYSYDLNDGYLSDEEVAALLGDYQYVDFEDKKVRVICLYTAEADSMDIVPPTNYSGGEGMTNKQLKWLAESLDLSAKEDAEEWGIIILGHHPLDWGLNYPAANLLHAYKEGTTYEFVRNGESITYDFEGKNDAELIAQFHGHLHNYKVDSLHRIETQKRVENEIEYDVKVGVKTDIKRIAVPQTNFYRPNSYGNNENAEWYEIEFGESVNYEKTKDTAEDTAFCVITVDLDDQKIYAYHYGAGIDRVIEYGNDVEE